MNLAQRMASLVELRRAEVAGSAPVVGRAIIMKRVPYSGLAFLILALLSMPAWAQARSHSNAPVHTGFSRAKSSRGRSSRHATVSRHAKPNDRSNKGGRVRGRERAEEVHLMNRRRDAHRGFTAAPGVERAEGERARTRAGRSTGRSNWARHAERGKSDGDRDDANRR